MFRIPTRVQPFVETPVKGFGKGEVREKAWKVKVRQE